MANKPPPPPPRGGNAPPETVRTVSLESSPLAGLVPGAPPPRGAIPAPHIPTLAAPPPPPRGRAPSQADWMAQAPAAVQAAAQQAMGAQGAQGYPQSGYAPAGYPAAPPPAPARAPFVPQPEPQPKVSEPSEKHMVALREGTVISGRYRVQQLLGRGGMGTVYAVTHTNTGEELALKLLHPALAENAAAVERFKTEARAPVRIGSENVVRVVDADVSAELAVPFMVMERLEGQDLRAELKRRGALPAGEVALYLKQVSRALDKAHQKGIVHRDLKPANLYIVRREDGSPLVKILDFGIAKLTNDASKELTVAGQVFGTPWYMAPEQAKGDLARVGPQTDLWALGLIAYQLLTGRNYWTADGMAALIGQICYEPMTPPSQMAPHLGPLFDMWFTRACHRDPAQRFGSAGEMIEELAQALGVSVAAGMTTSSRAGADSSMQLQIAMGQSQPTPGGGVPGMGSQPSVPSSNPLANSQQLASQSQQLGNSNLNLGSPLGQSHHPLGQSHHPLGNTGSPMGSSVAGMSASQPLLDAAMGGPLPMAQPRRSSAIAVALGVVAALILGAGATGVYLLSQKSGAKNAAASASAVVAAPEPAETAAPSAASEPAALPSSESTASASATASASVAAHPTAPGSRQVVATPPARTKSSATASKPKDNAPKVNSVHF